MGQRSSIRLTAVIAGIVSGLSFMNVEPGFGAEPFAVVELFSSEGCSSCPPADELLSAIEAEARQQGQRVFTLSYQVDYWDYLGWKDPSSRPEFTRRQNLYADAAQASSVYTPQMIVNGHEFFVGSDGTKARVVIQEELSASAVTQITLTQETTENGRWGLEYLSSPVANADLNLALVEKSLEVQVTAGENAGRMMKHVHIVRELKTLPADQPKGRVTFEKDPAAGASDFLVIAFVQEKNNGRILGAQEIELK